MEALIKLSSVMGLSLTSGVNLYATVAVVGLVSKFNMIKGLPPEFQAFDNDAVIFLAIALYLCEFAVDKIPGFDSLWDSIHTIIRPFGAALVSLTIVGEADPSVEVLTALLGSSLALATHTAKAGTRLVVNTSPEPFSNIALSVAEDVGVVGFSLLVISHPVISLIISLILLILLVWLGPGLWRGALLVLKAIVVRLYTIFSGAAAASPEALPDGIAELVDEEFSKGEPVRATIQGYLRKVKGCGRNRKGYMILTDKRILFVFRKLFRSQVKSWDLSEVEKAKLQKKLLFDILAIKSDGKFFQVIVLKNRSGLARKAHELLSGATGAEDSEAPAGRGEPRPGIVDS
ncbi:MAG: DUF4126 domain-containing protein [Candidatus Abyssobacteria bacterium SURF_5]|uniref:DUF4126 domain-containing protein n=1 Tax=Abyssobacteria bacterium (strain SURF_5) TaxID=2093360 RepID=A0A3A4P8A7_ABYX5|nr:MAG: DUF4126 domain-containing protein [Candidatus Abyssubacteria bacterium SURF_5]